MGNEDVNVTVTYRQVFYTLTIRYPAVGEDREVADPTVMQLPAGSGYRVAVPEVEGYTSLIDEVTGVMPANNREISVLMIGEEATAILGDGTPTIVIEDERTALGINNAVLGSGEIIE